MFHCLNNPTAGDSTVKDPTMRKISHRCSSSGQWLHLMFLTAVVKLANSGERFKESPTTEGSS